MLRDVSVTERTAVDDRTAKILEEVHVDIRHPDRVLAERFDLDLSLDLDPASRVGRARQLAPHSYREHTLVGCQTALQFLLARPHLSPEVVEIRLGLPRSRIDPWSAEDRGGVAVELDSHRS